MLLWLAGGVVGMILLLLVSLQLVSKKPDRSSSTLKTEEAGPLAPAALTRETSDGSDRHQTAVAKVQFPGNADDFVIQYMNDTPHDIMVWLDNMCPCAKTAAVAGECADHDLVDDRWVHRNPASAWSDPIRNLGRSSLLLGPSTRRARWKVVEDRELLPRKKLLRPGEVWRIHPPKDAQGYPFWCTDQRSGAGTFARNCPGVGSWVTVPGVDMPAVGDVTRFEYNINFNAARGVGEIWYNASSVDGLNLNHEMEYDGHLCLPTDRGRRCVLNLETCPRYSTHQGIRTCPSVKFWEDAKTADGCGTKDPPVSYLRARRSYGHGERFDDDELVPQNLSGCGYGSPSKKESCHRWWTLNKTCARTWLDFLQKTPGQPCEQYGWAYDEMKWTPGTCRDAHDEHCLNDASSSKLSEIVDGAECRERDGCSWTDSWSQTPGEEFDVNGNPNTNSSVHPLMRCDIAPRDPQKGTGSSLNIRITRLLDADKKPATAAVASTRKCAEDSAVSCPAHSSCDSSSNTQCVREENGQSYCCLDTGANVCSAVAPQKVKDCPTHTFSCPGGQLPCRASTKP